MRTKTLLSAVLFLALAVAVGPAAQAEPVCGNGVVEGIEQCDDGNVEIGDGCNAGCKAECASDADCANGQPCTTSGYCADCTKHCDCPQGWFCYKNSNCLRDARQAVYCCEKAGCPPGVRCIGADGQTSRCGETADYFCNTACDCGPAHCCKDNKCVLDIDDPWWTSGGVEVGPPCVKGVDATYCASQPVCFAGYQAWGWTPDSDFRCFNPYVSEVRSFCGGEDCFFAGDCPPGSSCVDTRGTSYTPPGTLSSADGGGCYGDAIAEAVFGWAPQDLLRWCGKITDPGKTCETGWRPGDINVIERVVGESGSCGNGTCEFLLGETSANCAADCSCGDGYCDTSEVGTCTPDCGICDSTGCEQPVVPTEWSTLSVCGDGVCQRDGVIPENCVNCWLDCDAVNDSDGDTILDGCDNCPTDSNPDQANNDGDLDGDVCDPDDDNDGQTDVDETACGSDPLDAASMSPDFDGDFLPDCVDTDDDGDGVADSSDLCAWTLMDEPAPDEWKKNRYWTTPTGQFLDPSQRDSGYTIIQTGGCSAPQIIEEAGLGGAHIRFGITKSALTDWVNGLP